MEFKSNKKGKKKALFEDAPKNYLLSEDNEWENLQKTVKSDQDSKKRNYNPFSKKSSAFDELPEEDLRKVEVNIKLSLPKVDVARFKGLHTIISWFPKQFSRIKIPNKNRTLIVGVASLLLITLGIVAVNKYLLNNNNSGAEVAGSSKVVGQEVPTPTNDPTFSIVKPQGRDLPKEKIIFDPRRKFAKFEDEINGVPISVSQQPLPEGIKSDPVSGTSKLAKDFGAAEEITVDGTRINYGQDEKGQQTVILTKNGLLIFILTSAQTDKEGLKIYAGNLN